MSKKTVVFDFDGVIHRYSKGWQDGSIYDKPTEGIYEVLGQLKQKNYEIVIVSTRCSTDEGMQEINDWLERYGLNGLIDKVCKEKPPAMVYVDDRAIKFDGNNIGSLVSQIENFKTWQQIEHIKGDINTVDNWVKKFGLDKK